MKKCARCQGSGYKRLPPGHYGLIPCIPCNGTGNDPIHAIRELGKKIAAEQQGRASAGLPELDTCAE